MAFVWLWRSTGKAPRLTKRARTMVDFLEELPDRAATKSYLHRPRLLVADQSLPFVASSFFPGPVNQRVRCKELLPCFKPVPIWRESPCSFPCAGCFVHGGLGKSFGGVSGRGPPGRSGQGPGGNRPVPSPEDFQNYGPFRDDKQIGKYMLGRELGKGSFGLVRGGFNVETGEMAAVKEISKAVLPLAVPQCKMQMRREIFAMAKVCHPNIVQLKEVLATKASIFLVMELMPGGDLQTAVSYRNPRITEAQARRYFQQIITAVDFCHAKGVYHRDLKPGNVLLDANDNAKVADFGLGAMADADTFTDITGSLLLKSKVGTPVYMAPEILIVHAGGAAGYDGAKADIFSCGFILYFLLARQLPFSSKTTSRTEVQRMKLVADYNPWPKEIRGGARKLIMSMLDPNPATRITMASILQDSWFKEDYQPPNFLKIKEVAASIDELNEVFSDPDPWDRSQLKPANLNAFALIADAKAFNLGDMLEGEATGWEVRRYISHLPAFQILNKMVFRMTSFGYRGQCKGYKVRFMEASKQQHVERFGPLCIIAEVLQVGDNVLVEVRKVTGDATEYKHFLVRLTTSLRDELEPIEP